MPRLQCNRSAFHPHREADLVGQTRPVQGFLAPICAVLQSEKIEAWPMRAHFAHSRSIPVRGGVAPATKAGERGADARACCSIGSGTFEGWRGVLSRDNHCCAFPRNRSAICPETFFNGLTVWPRPGPVSFALSWPGLPPKYLLVCCPPFSSCWRRAVSLRRCTPCLRPILPTRNPQSAIRNPWPPTRLM